ncbi:ArsR family transcriptional regulator [Nocardia camponoti]|nr:ArsR family transcriptional regulator [Nocardia camponoti]
MDRSHAQIIGALRDADLTVAQLAEDLERQRASIASDLRHLAALGLVRSEDETPRLWGVTEAALRWTGSDQGRAALGEVTRAPMDSC